MHMKRTISIIFFMLSVAFFSFIPSDEYVEVEVLYQVNAYEEALELAETFDLELIHVSRSGVARFLTQKDTKIDDILSSGFVYNHQSETFRPPWQRTEDPYLKDQYALDLMQTKQAWNITLGSQSVVVAIIDTGIDTKHDEFKGRISPLSYNAYTESVGISFVEDDNGHGTMVAGVIGAIKDNGRGIAGIAPNISLLVIKANQPNQGYFSDSALIEGIYYAVGAGADIINLSLGGPGVNSLIEKAIDYAFEQGVIVIAAAGNNGNDGLLYPAAYKNVIAVSAVDSNQKIAIYSNYGPHIDISAPGSQIITTYLNNGYVTTSGTSFSAPQVAGVFALMKSYLKLSTKEYITRLMLSSIDLGAVGKDPYYGVGMVQTYASLVNTFVTYQFQTYQADAIEPIVILKDQTIQLKDASLVDHIFEGWFFDEAFTIPFINNQTIVSEDATLYAKFNSAYVTVRLDVLSNLNETFTLLRGETLELKEIDLEGYRFLGWTYDPEHLIPYNQAPFNNDTTLYAHLIRIEYVDISYYDKDILLETIRIEKGQMTPFVEYEKVGHTFLGWYVDPTFENGYEIQSVNQNLSLYGKFNPNIYTVTLIGMDGITLDTIQVAYGTIGDLPLVTLERYTFIDWFIDETFITLYQETYITEDTVLYAKFVENAYTLTLMIDQEVYLIETLEENQMWTPSSIERLGYQFKGWYIDLLYETLYTPVEFKEDITLYGYFEISTHRVIFYDFDQSILFDQEIPHGEVLDIPQGPQKPSTTHLEYRFSHWDQTTYRVYENLEFYPLYDMRLKVESVSLNPGIDTIGLFETWVDAGIHIEDTFDVLVSSQIQSDVLGSYVVTYDIYKEDRLLYTLLRHVRVIEVIKVKPLTLNPGIDTIELGDIHIDKGVIEVEEGIVIVENQVDISKPGTYLIIYRYEGPLYFYETVRYVQVLEKNMPMHTQPLLFFNPKRRGGYHEDII
jgi:hypothetical protein